MSNSNAVTVARGVLEDSVLALDAEITWRTEDLVDVKIDALKLDRTIDELRRKRTALKDAIRIHFPVSEW